jgi:oligopeptide transport system permease protein
LFFGAALLRFLAKRLAACAAVIVVVSMLTFFIVRLAPGGPFDREKAFSASAERAIRAKYHLDESLPKQYLRYVRSALHGDFGVCFANPAYGVGELIMKRFPRSLVLGASALFLAVLFGIAAGSIAALRRNSLLDFALTSFSMAGVVVPNFVVGPVLVLVFAVGLGWFNVSGWGNVGTFVLPVITLALPYAGRIAKLTRGSMIEVLQQDFIRTAYSKGLGRGEVIVRHALKPALLPVVSYLGPAAAAIFTGSIVVETIFGIPGLGPLFASAAFDREYAIISGLVLLYGTLLVFFNLLVDLAYAWLDPRVRLG